MMAANRTYRDNFVTNTKNQQNPAAAAAGQYSAASSASSTTTGARACARTREEIAMSRAEMLHGQFVDVCEYYAENFRRHPAPVIQRRLAFLIRDGMSPDVIRAAMDETQLAPRPSWAYCDAILRRCERDGILTLSDWSAEKERFSSSRSAYSDNPALRYEQRSDAETNYMSLFIDLDNYSKGGPDEKTTP